VKSEQACDEGKLSRKGKEETRRPERGRRKGRYRKYCGKGRTTVSLYEDIRRQSIAQKNVQWGVTSAHRGPGGKEGLGRP